MSFDVDKLRADLHRMESPDWVRHYDLTQPSGWTTLPLRAINGSLNGPDSIRHGPFEQYQNTPLLDEFPYMREIIEAFKCPIGRVRLSKMAPHMAINAHRDINDEVASVAFGQVRLHLPIATNEKVLFLVGKEILQMAPGRLYYADFAKNHAVRNDGDEVRVHLFFELKMNDWLKEIFPKFTLLERIDMALQRVFLPIFWKVRNFWIFNQYVNLTRKQCEKQFEGSATQRAWRRLRHRAT